MAKSLFRFLIGRFRRRKNTALFLRGYSEIPRINWHLELTCPSDLGLQSLAGPTVNSSDTRPPLAHGQRVPTAIMMLAAAYSTSWVRHERARCARFRNTRRTWASSIRPESVREKVLLLLSFLPLCMSSMYIVASFIIRKKTINLYCNGVLHWVLYTC